MLEESSRVEGLKALRDAINLIYVVILTENIRCEIYYLESVRNNPGNILVRIQQYRQLCIMYVQMLYVLMHWRINVHVTGNAAYPIIHSDVVV